MDDRNSTTDRNDGSGTSRTDSGTHGASYMGADNVADTNTNLDATVSGGPQTGTDQAATEEIADQYAQDTLPGAVAQTPDPTRQNDNSGMLQPGASPRDERADGADIIGQSGNDRNNDDDTSR